MASNPNRITIQNARIRFSNGVFTASSPPNTTAPPAFSAKFILAPNHPQLKDVVAKVQAAALATFKGRAQAMLAQAEAAGKCCLQKGEKHMSKEGEVYTGFAGNMVLSARNPNAPIVLQGLNKVARDGSKIYDGCMVNVQVDIFGYTKGSNGVGARLLVVQFAADGEPLGGGGPGTVEDFGEVAEAAGTEFSESLFGA